MPATSLIVIGASAGGMPALIRLTSQFPASLRAAVLAVRHCSSIIDVEDLAARLSVRSMLSCQAARNGAELENRTLHLARPDRHLLVSGGHIVLASGARENHHTAHPRTRSSVQRLWRGDAG